MKRSMKLLMVVLILAMFASIISIAATAKMSDEEEEYRVILLAGKFYKIHESDEITGDVEYLMENTDYVAIKMKYVSQAFGEYVPNMDSPGAIKQDTPFKPAALTQADTNLTCENGMCYVDSVLDEETNNTTVCESGECYTDSILDEQPSPKTVKVTVPLNTEKETKTETITEPTLLDDDETIALFTANTKMDVDTSIDDTAYPMRIKTALDDAGVENEIWTVKTDKNTIYMNVFELKSGKQLKAFTYKGRPREVTSLSEGSDIMAKRLLCKTCNKKVSFGKARSISK